jgi:hypothetical protein
MLNSLTGKVPLANLYWEELAFCSLGGRFHSGTLTLWLKKQLSLDVLAIMADIKYYNVIPHSDCRFYTDLGGKAVDWIYVLNGQCAYSMIEA